MEASVFATPALLRQEALAGATAVVIDALRMTSVAAVAVEHGCTGLMAAAEVDEARRVAAWSGALLGGERQALPIEGFDFSNSPHAYTKARVGGHKLVMTTSNGTQAILAAWAAERLLLGAFVNVSALAEAVQSADRLIVVCAGTLGAFTLEDTLAAGALLMRLPARGLKLDDMGHAALMLYKAARGDLHAALAPTRHYKRLQSIGLQDDLDFCLREDSVVAVPERRGDGWFA